MRTSQLNKSWIVQENNQLPVAPERNSPERLAVDLPFLNAENGRLKLGGIYKKQQTSYDIHTIRFFLQEDGYGQKALSILCDYVVGANGIQVDFGDDTVNNLWRAHQFDAMHPERGFGEIQRFQVKSLARDGEYINHIVADVDSFFIPSIDVLDLPLNTSRKIANNTSGIAYTTQYDSGIDRDTMKRPVQYRFMPEDGRPYSLSAEYVIHNFPEVYAGQERGLSWFLGCVDTMADLSGFETNVAQAVKNAASDPGHYSVPERWFGVIRSEDAETPESARAILNRTMTRSPDRRGILPESVSFTPSDIGNVFTGDVTKAHRASQLARISACIGLSYFTVSGDLSSANFSSLQQGNLDNRALFRAAQNLLLESVKQIVKKWMLWISIVTPGILRRVQDAVVRFFLPPFEYIDRQKAAMADKSFMELGATSLSAIITAQGQDPDAVFRQQAEDERKRRDWFEHYDVPYPGDKNDSLTEQQEDDKIDSEEDTDDADNKESEKNS